MTTNDRDDARPANGLVELRARYAELLSACRMIVILANRGEAVYPDYGEVDLVRAAVARAEGR